MSILSITYVQYRTAPSLNYIIQNHISTTTLRLSLQGSLYMQKFILSETCYTIKPNVLSNLYPNSSYVESDNTLNYLPQI